MKAVIESVCLTFVAVVKNRMTLCSVCFCLQVKSVINLLFAAFTGDVSALRRCSHSLMFTLLSYIGPKLVQVLIHFT